MIRWQPTNAAAPPPRRRCYALPLHYRPPTAELVLLGRRYFAYSPGINWRKDPNWLDLCIV